MTTYIPADVTHVARGHWRAYVPFLDDFADATSRPALEHEVFRRVEESHGLRSFVITWREV